jgi:hypothetical protein
MMKTGFYERLSSPANLQRFSRIEQIWRPQNTIGRYLSISCNLERDTAIVND